jgi:hypothetical protein
MSLGSEGALVSYLLAFSPWIAFALIPGGDWNWAALAATALSVVGIVSQTRGGLPLDAQIIAIGSAAYFAALTVLAFADPHTTLHAYTAALASGALGLIGLVSLITRRPYTLGLAKLEIPRHEWDNPLFFRVNVIITAIWTASFIIGGTALALLVHDSAAIRSIVQGVAFVIPAAITVRYVTQQREQEKARQAAAASGSGQPAPSV